MALRLFPLLGLDNKFFPGIGGLRRDPPGVVLWEQRIKNLRAGFAGIPIDATVTSTGTTIQTQWVFTDSPVCNSRHEKRLHVKKPPHKCIKSKERLQGA